MRAVKLSLSLLALVALASSLGACNTLANRRSLYSPKKGDGYWTRSLDDGRWKERGTEPADVSVKKGGKPRAVEPAPAPAAPPSEALPDQAAPATPQPSI